MQGKRKSEDAGDEFWNYKFLNPMPKRKCSDGRKFRVHWIDRDGSLMFKDDGKREIGYIKHDELSEDLQAKYNKDGTIKREYRKALQKRKKERLKETRKRKLYERAEKKAAKIPEKMSATKHESHHYVVQVDRMYGCFGAHPVYQVQRHAIRRAIADDPIQKQISGLFKYDKTRRAANRMHNHRLQVRLVVRMLLLQHSIEPAITLMIMEYLEYEDFFPIIFYTYKSGFIYNVPTFHHLFTSPIFEGTFASKLDMTQNPHRRNSIQFHHDYTYLSFQRFVRCAMMKLLAKAYHEWIGRVDAVPDGLTFESFVLKCKLPSFLETNRQPIYIAPRYLRISKTGKCEYLSQVWEKGKDFVEITRTPQPRWYTPPRWARRFWHKEGRMQFEFGIFCYFVGHTFGATIRLGDILFY